MARPGVYISKGNGAIGGLLPKEDGVAIMVISSSLYSATTTDPFYKPVTGFQLADFEALGITEATDKTRGEFVWEHLKDFYAEAVNGAELHLMFYPVDVTYATLLAAGLTNTHIVRLQNYLKEQSGRIKLAIFAQNPSFVEVVWATSPELFQSLADSEFAKVRPLDILVEGRKMPAISGITLDMRSYNAPNVSMFWSREKTRAAALKALAVFSTKVDNYAAIGTYAGRVASIDVATNPGDASLGKIKGWSSVEFSNGTSVADLSDGSQDSLNTNGFVFATTRPGVTGFWFVDSHTCCAITDDYAYLERNRVINKAVRLANVSYQKFVLGKVYIDPSTGKISADTIGALTGDMKSVINDNMEGEIINDGTVVTMDPNQNVLTTGETNTIVEVLPIGINRILKVKVQFRNPARV